MKDKEDDIEGLFRNRFENDETPVSPIVWENIEKTLPKEPTFTDFLFFQSILFWWLSGLLFVSVIVAAITYHSIFSSKKNTAISFSLSNKNNPTIKYQVKNTDSTYNLTEHSAIVPFIEQTASSIIADSGLQKEFITNSKRSNKKEVCSMDHIYSASYGSSIIYKKSNGEKTNPDERTLNDRKKQKRLLGKNAFVQKKNNVSQNKRSTISEKQPEKITQTPIVPYTSSESLQNSDALSLQLSSENNLSVDSILVNDSGNYSKSSEILSDNLIKKSISKNNHELIQKKSVVLHAKTDSSQSMIVDTNIVQLSVVDSVQTFSTSDSTMLKENNHLRSYREEAKELSGTINEIFSKTEYESEKNRSKKNRLTSDSTSSVINSPIVAPTPFSTEIKKDSLFAKIDSTEKASSDSVLTKESSEKKKNKESIDKRWSIDILGSVALTGSTIKAIDASYQNSISDKKDRTKNLPGYTFGLTINYKLNDKFRIAAGASYVAFAANYPFKYNLKKQDSSYVDSSWQYTSVDSINTDKTVKDQYRFLSIPLQVSYTFLTKGKISLSAIAGIRSNILLRGVTHLANANGTDVMELNNGFRSLSFSYLVALEMQYQFKPRMALLVQPAFNYSANSIYNSSSPIQQKLYSIGVTIGLRITF